MAFNYDPSLLSAASSVTANLMKVRRMVGDTDETWPFLADDEIYGALYAEPSPTLAAAVCADWIAAFHRRQCNMEAGELRVSAAARWRAYADLADDLRAGGPGDIPGDPSVIHATAYVGGANVDEKTTLKEDENRTEDSFALGQDDRPDNSTNGIG